MGLPHAEERSLMRVRKQLQMEALEHPLTKYPFVVSVIMLGYAFLVAPFLGGFVPTFPLGLAAGAVFLGNLGWRLSHINQEYTSRMQKLMEQQSQGRQEAERARLEKMRRELEEGFLSIGAQEGSKALVELVNEYKALEKLLNERKEDAFLSGARIRVLAKETYEQGLNVLLCALDLMRAVQPTNKEGLKAAIAQLEREVASLKHEGAREGLIKIKEASLTSHVERFRRLEDQSLRTTELLHQADSCEGVLLTARLDLIQLRADSSGEGLDEVIRRLQRVIDTAIEVQEALKRSQGVSA